MTVAGATLAIVRRSIDRRFAAIWLAAFAIVFALAAATATELGRTAAVVLLVLAEAPAATFDRRVDLMHRVSLYAMPLYGRQLARALVIAPCLASVAAPVGVIVAFAMRGVAFRDGTDIALLLAAIAATLVRPSTRLRTATAVAASARLRTGANASLYVALSLAAHVAIVAPLLLHAAHPLLWSVPLAAVIGYFALRAFGETLARYDPLPA